MNTATLLWSLLRISLVAEGSEDATATYVRSVTDEMTDADWEQLMQIARHNRVTGLCCYGLERSGCAISVPRRLWLRWLGERAMVEQQYRRMIETTDQLTHLFNQNSIDVCELKGGRIAACYPRPELREYDDIDIYLYGRDDEGDMLMASQGIAIDHSENDRSIYHFHGIKVEQHHTFSNNRHARSNVDFDLMLKELVPSATFETLFLLRHTASHFAFSHITVKAVCDWTQWVRAEGHEVLWPLVADKLKHFGMMPFASGLQHIAEQYLCCPPVAELHASLPDEVVTRRMADAFILGGQGRPSRERKGVDRILWKMQRHIQNRWRRRLAFGDSESSLLTHTLGEHLQRRTYKITTAHHITVPKPTSQTHQ